MDIYLLAVSIIGLWQVPQYPIFLTFIAVMKIRQKDVRAC